jgi:hypothetical protein
VPARASLPRCVTALVALTLSGFGCSGLLDIEHRSARRQGLTECDAAMHPDCPATAEGTPELCFATHTLGGEDFCVERCDPAVGPSDPEHFACLGTGALVRICDPAVTGACPEGLSCYRTELVSVSDAFYPAQPPGLCLRMPVCGSNADCRHEGVRRECGSEVIESKYPTLTVALALDHLHCVEPCAASQAPCASGEACLSVAVADPSLPSICVPSCADEPCPPNFYCLTDTGPGYPAVCVPGIPGVRCSHPEDCMIGYCADTGAGFSTCTIDCDSDTACQLLSPISSSFLCLNGHCESKPAYSGENCIQDSDCPADKHCSWYNPYDPLAARDRKKGECRRSCDAGGHCEARGGMPFVCLPTGECYPGDLGLGCASSDECMGELTCVCVEHCDDPAQARSICSQACVHDEDCTGYERAAKICVNGWCELAPT